VDKVNSRRLAQQSLDLLHELYRQSPADYTILYELVAVNVRLAELDYDPVYPRQAIAFGNALLTNPAGQGPARLRPTLYFLALSHRLLGWSLIRRNQNQEALAEARNAKDLDVRAASMPPGVPLSMSVSFDLHLTGICYLKLNDMGRARDFVHRANELRRGVFETNRHDEWIQHRFLEGLSFEGWIAERQGDWANASSIYQQASALVPSLTAAQTDREWSYLLGFVYGSQGVAAKRQGRQAAACELFARSAAYYQAGGRATPEDDRGPRAEQVTRELAGCARQ
jgi:tetratricopeptide (TPR) repeat protein